MLASEEIQWVCEGPMKGRERGNVNAVKEGAVVEKVFSSSPPSAYTPHSSLLGLGMDEVSDCNMNQF